MNYFKSISEKVPPIVLGASSVLTVTLLIGIFVFLFITGIQTFDHVKIGDFLLNTNWNPSAYKLPTWGILSLLAGTLIIAIASLSIAVPFGIAIAIYLSEIAGSKTREFCKPIIEMITSIPSVVFGLLGLLFVAPTIANLTNQSSGLNAFSASLLVAVITIPTIASMCEDAISSVRNNIREASLALGATHWETIKRVVLPAAKSGIFAGIMLGLGRAIGETMIVLMVAGNSRAFPQTLLSPISPITATIAIDIKEVVQGSTHWQSLFALGCILFILTFFVNFLADIFIHRR